MERTCSGFMKNEIKFIPRISVPELYLPTTETIQLMLNSF